MSIGLSDFYKEVNAGRVESNEPAPPSSGMYKAELDGRSSPVGKMMYIGEQEADVSRRSTALADLTRRAKNGLTGALDDIVDKYGKEEATFTVKLPASMVDKDGRLVDAEGIAHERFGVKQIESERQMEILRRDVETAKAYFPDAQLMEMHTADNKHVAIVTGAGAREFNAVIRAEREMQSLQYQAKFLAEQKREVQEQMGLKTDVAIFGGKEAAAPTAAVGVPAGAKTHERELA